MKIPWPQPFEDGNVESFLEDFEDVAEAAGLKTDRMKLAALRMLVKGRAKAVLQTALCGLEKMDWAAAKEALRLGFDTPADRQEAMRSFNETAFGEGMDTMVYLSSLRQALKKALPHLDRGSEARLLEQRFVQGMPSIVRNKLKTLLMVRPIEATELAVAAKTLLAESHEVVGNVEQGWVTELKTSLETVKEEIAALKTKRNQRRALGCFRCGQEGHFRRNCPLLRRDYFVNKKFDPCVFPLGGEHVIGAVNPIAIRAQLIVGGVQENCLIDTGAAVSLVGRRNGAKIKSCPITVKAVGGFDLRIDGMARYSVEIGTQTLEHSFVVPPDTQQTIIGADFLGRVRAVIDLKNDCLLTEYGMVPLLRKSKSAVGQLDSPTIAIPKCPYKTVNAVIARHRELFTGDDDPFGFCPWIEHKITLREESFRPFGPRRVPIHLQQEIERQVNVMLKAGIIEEANSLFNSPVLLVKKPNGKFRFCVDFRRLNEITENEVFPVPSVSEVFDKLQNANVFTVLDLRSGYWQVAIKQADRDKTAFTVGEKQYRFKRMPFGLSGAPYTFRRLMLKVLEGVEGAAVYGDDIVIYSEGEDQHAQRLEAVLKRIAEAGLRINVSKSQVAKEMVVLLGQKVGRGEIQPLPEKLLTIEQAQTPASKRKLRQFLGRAGFYSRFVKNFNDIASPLYKLLKKERQFNWTEEAESAFSKITEMFKRRHLTLKLPVIGEKFTVATDASDVGIGAVLR